MSSAEMETEQSYAGVSGPTWRSEPFRLFFILGVLLSWVGVGHWILYGTGVTSTYSCETHGFVQMQSFLMAFAVGFLLTALPRRTRTPPPAVWEVFSFVSVLLVTATAAWIEQWAVTQISYGLTFLLLLQFALRRFLASAARRPPAAFVLIPLGVLHGLIGATCIILATQGMQDPTVMRLGKLLVEQGVFLCFVLGVGSLVLPLMGGAPPPPDLGSSPRERRKAIAYVAAGLAIFASLVLEHLGWTRGGPLLRALVVALGLGFGGGAWRPPSKPGFHRRLVWTAVWLMPVGLVASVVWPDYRVPALHILFIGGFGLMAFGVATHVALSHIEGMEPLALGRPLPIVFMAVMLLLALLGRLAADASESYFGHLAWASVWWVMGGAAWLAFLGPSLLRRRP
jgi:uncharacterized protein involved in response to NO